MTYLLTPDEPRFQDCEYVDEIVRNLIDAGAPRPKLYQLAQRLAELGCDNAQELADWIDRASR